MSEVKERIQTHRDLALVLLEEASRTAQLHAGFRLAGAISHLARAQALLQEELDGLSLESNQEDLADGSVRRRWVRDVLEEDY